MGELLSVKVSIANRSYPLRITSEEQEKVASAAENINNRIRELEDNYAVKDKQDLLAMTALQIASEAMGSKKSSVDQIKNDVEENISYLNNLIEEYLQTENSSL